MPKSNPLDEIAKIQAQIAALQETALQELKERRAALVDELKVVEHEIEKLTGIPKKAARAARSFDTPSNGHAPIVGKKPDLQELKALLAEAPDRTISLRKEGFDVANVRVMAQANPHLLQMGGKGAWPTVTLLR